MNEPMPQSLFFISLPDLGRLCAVKIILNPGILNPGIRDAQIKLCRYLLFLHEDIMASPEQEPIHQISVVMAISFYKTGKVQAVAEKHGAKMEAPERVTPAKLQTCLSYTLLARLSPHWNKAGHLLIQVMDLNVSETHLCISIQVYKIRLPPCELEDFDISTTTLKSFVNNKSSVILRHSLSSNWCYILPSMKMGQIISISHVIPPESPFKTYKDFQIHWNRLYGYELPEASSEDVIYCSVYFKLIGDKLFTYPFICLRSQPVQFFPRVDLSGVLSAFVSDLKSRLSHLCGFPVKMTSKPFYPNTELTRPQSQDSQSRLVNLTAELLPRSLTQAAKLQCVTNSAMCIAETGQKVAPLTQQPRHVFANLNLIQRTPATQLVVKSATSAQSFGSQSCCSAGSQSEKVGRIIPIFQRKFLQMNQNNIKTPEEKKRETFLQSTSINVGQGNLEKFNLCVSQVHKSYKDTTTKDFTKKNSEHAVSGNSNVKPFRPSFSRKPESRAEMTNNLVNSAACTKNKKETFIKNIYTAFDHQPSHVNKWLLTPVDQTYQGEGSIPTPSSAQNYLQERTYLQTSKSDHETIVCFSQKSKEQKNNESTLKKSKQVRRPVSSSIACTVHVEGNTQEEFLEVKPKKLKTKPAIQDVDVENHAKNNQLSKLNSATLQNWLKQRGVSVKTRDKKEELVTKIMQFINE
ncbi:uncharacterized protein C18orf63 homolog isoform X2 [Ascaphus truei]|uniref:uncharacterized protein C18orf63 homolog isoform X2 n=1 Tax=Ascaphus truei TaxID=8439 RepID=UPI003F5A0B4F